MTKIYGAVTLLNSSGHVTIAWTDERAEEMEKMIAEKMEQGFTFFIIEPRFGGLVAPKHTPLTNSAKLSSVRAVAVGDSDFARMVDAGAASVEKTPPAKAKTVRRAKTAKEAVSAETVAIRPLQGG